MNTGHKLNVHKTFRRRTIRPLEVLCTFNFRSVSRGSMLNYDQTLTLIKMTIN